MKKIKYIESEKLELKSTLSEREEILETVSAFSNTKGGRIFIGINPDGKVIGVDIGVNTVENLANLIKNSTDPKVFPTIEIEQHKSKKIIILTIPEYPSKPVFVKERVYIRVGKTNQRASAEKIRQLIKQSQPCLWDKQINSSVNLKDINTAKVKTFLHSAEIERNVIFEGIKSSSNILNQLKLIEKNKVTNAAILLFGKNPQKEFYRSMVKCGRFRGSEPIDFIDMQNIEGTIIEQVPAVMNFISRHINISVKISGSPQREEIWEYPKDALREAVVNAICHRNYEDTGNVQVRIFDNRLEIWNPGELPPEITIESLKKTHPSKPRNELIAKCFYLIKYIEQWGTGTNRIVRLCKEANLPEPQFDLVSGTFIVTFLRNTRFEAEGQFLKKQISDESNLTDRIIDDTILEYLEITWDKVNEIVLSLSQVCPKSISGYAFTLILLFTRKETDILTLMDALKQTNRTRFRNKILKPMIDEGFVNYTLPDKPNSPGQKYIITEKGIELLKKHS